LSSTKVTSSMAAHANEMPRMRGASAAKESQPEPYPSDSTLKLESQPIKAIEQTKPPTTKAADPSIDFVGEKVHDDAPNLRPMISASPSPAAI